MLPRWKRASTVLATAALIGLSLSGTHCASLGKSPAFEAEPPASPANPAGAPYWKHTAKVAVPGVVLDETHTVGPPLILGSLAVFPVYATEMEDLGEFTTLEAALERETAVVHEVGADGQLADGSQQQRGNYRGDGAAVNTLVIENLGGVTILVLAGTVVKGGKQDRQIGQDFVIGSKQSVPVDAFCVEHGRWNATRDGQATAGKFKAMKVLANGDVRGAGQYEQNQSKVWSKVGAINRASKKETASDTLTASLEDKDTSTERAALALKELEFLASVPVADHVVGFAYAVGGEVQGARWFFHHALFGMYEETLVNTAVNDAFAARAAAKAAGQAEPKGAATPEVVAAFVTDVAKGRDEKRSTAAENDNHYQFSDDGVGYGSSAEMKAPSGSPKSKPKTVTKDFLRAK
jgi:hypothetical protein